MQNNMVFNNLIEFIDYFSDDVRCVEYLEQRRWPDGPQCPYVSHRNETKVYRYKDGKTFKCSKCRKKFSVRTGTIFANSNLPLRKWFVAIYLITSHKKGITSYQLARDIGVTQKTAWLRLHKIRKLFAERALGAMEGIVEIDEAYVGGSEKNKHANKKCPNPMNNNNKTTVLGILERGKRVMAIVLPSSKAKYLIPPILKNVKPNTIIITDQLAAYKRLGGYYRHYAVRHSHGEYVVGLAHTNTIEGFWSHLKRGITGTYHHASPKHLQGYCDEYSFRYNTRDLSEYDRFNRTLGNVG